MRPQHTLETRLAQVRKSYPRLYQQAYAELSENPNILQIALIFRDWWVDSALEALFWLRLAGRTAVPAWLPPSYRLHKVICPRTELVVSDRPHPCLILQRAIWFPQVTVDIPGRARHRLDGLVCTGPNRWRNVEIDGDGHRGWNDARRDEDLAIPVLRVDAADVQSRELLEKIDQFQRSNS